VRRLVSQAGAQLIRTRGDEVLPSLCTRLYESTTYRGEASGSSAPKKEKERSGEIRDAIVSSKDSTFGQVFERDVIEHLDLLHDQFLFVDLDHERSVVLASGEPELADRILQLLGDIYGMRLGLIRGDRLVS
jgi:hypothetical protein